MGALGMASLASLQAGLLDVDLKLQLGVTTCTGGGSNCSVTINAMGDTIELDVTKLPVKELGTISQDKVIKLALPQEENERVVYSYIPSEGELSGKKIYLTLENRPQAPGTRLAGKTVIKLYRQIEGDKVTQWIDVGEITSQAKEGLPVNELPFMFKAGGNIETENPSKKAPDGSFEKVTFVLGKRNVNPTV